MSREKGLPKTGGRKAGTPNKATQSIKEHITDIINDNKEQMIEDLRSLRPKDRLTILVGLMQYVLPKQQNVRGDIDMSTVSSEIVIRYVGEDGDEVFPSDESEVDLERGPYLEK